MEKVQNRFLRFLAFKRTTPGTPHSSCSPLLTYLNLESLEQRRILLDLSYFIYQLLNIDRPDVFSRRLTFLVSSSRTQSVKLFYLKSQTTNYATTIPLFRITNIVNIYNIDPFCSTSLTRLKNMFQLTSIGVYYNTLSSLLFFVSFRYIFGKLNRIINYLIHVENK